MNSRYKIRRVSRIKISVIISNTRIIQKNIYSYWLWVGNWRLNNYEKISLTYITRIINFFSRFKILKLFRGTTLNVILIIENVLLHKIKLNILKY